MFRRCRPVQPLEVKELCLWTAPFCLDRITGTSVKPLRKPREPKPLMQEQVCVPFCSLRIFSSNPEASVRGPLRNKSTHLTH